MNKFYYQIGAGVVAGIGVGLLNGLLLTQRSLLGQAMLGGLLGAFFVLLLGQHMRSSGAALIWGQAYGLLWWLLGIVTMVPLLMGNGLLWTEAGLLAAAPDLLAALVGHGLILGGGYFGLLWLIEQIPSVDVALLQPKSLAPFSIASSQTQAMIVGALGGLLSAWLLLRWLNDPAIYVEIGSMVGSQSPFVGGIIAYTTAVLAGILFGRLFYSDIVSPGTALILGVAASFAGWLLLAFFFGVEVVSLTAVLTFAILLASFYVVVNRLWQLLFIDSDPLNRAREGVGVRSVRQILLGMGAGLLGGVFITMMMLSWGSFSYLGRLLQAESNLSGLVTYFGVNGLLGLLFGLFFASMTTSYGQASVWGLAYGAFCWLFGTNLLFSLWLNQPVAWWLPEMQQRYDSLIIFLFFGLALGLLLTWLTRRFGVRLGGIRANNEVETAVFAQQNTAVLPLPPLVVTLTILLPLLVSQ
ncbi:MAG: hypothetical protein AAF614_32735 [Chloroflexota bacterium]